MCSRDLPPTGESGADGRLRQPEPRAGRRERTGFGGYEKGLEIAEQGGIQASKFSMLSQKMIRFILRVLLITINDAFKHPWR
jgi:hypothetical protein